MRRGEGWARSGAAWGRLPRCLLRPQPGERRQRCRASQLTAATHTPGSAAGRDSQCASLRSSLRCCRRLWVPETSPCSHRARPGRAARQLRGAEGLRPRLVVWGREAENQDSIPLPWGLRWCLTPFSSNWQTFQEIPVWIEAAVSPRAIFCVGGFWVSSHCGPKQGFSEYKDFSQEVPALSHSFLI